MSLPPNYKSTKEYLIDVFDFLKKHQWLYNYPNTNILLEKVFEKFPDEWLPYLRNLECKKLYNFSQSCTDLDCPISLIEFIRQLQKLKPFAPNTTEQCLHTFPKNSGLKEKKIHEVLSLTPLIHNVCKENNCNVVVDVGAGLGYLSQLLAEKYDYSVLAVESCQEKIASAKKKNSASNVKYLHHFFTENSAEFIKSAMILNSESGNVCIVGLHACADLSVTIFDVFLKLNFVKALVIMPCCYHRMELRDEDGNRQNFKYFPISNMFKDLFETYQANFFLKKPFLRVACQQAGFVSHEISEDDLEKQARRLLFRAILQEVAEEENCEVKRLKRRTGKWNAPVQSTDEDFEMFLSNLKSSHYFECKNNSTKKIEMNDQLILRKMHDKWSKHKMNCYLLTVLKGFQAAMQRMCENILLLDRVEFLKEKGLQCFVKKVTNDRISPRCYALIATKQ